MTIHMIQNVIDLFVKYEMPSSDDLHCHVIVVIVKATNGPRYVVGCRRQLDKSKLKAGTRVALDMTTLTIMRFLFHLISVMMMVVRVCRVHTDSWKVVESRGI